jgi:hypothetical protein
MRLRLPPTILLEPMATAMSRANPTPLPAKTSLAMGPAVGVAAGAAVEDAAGVTTNEIRPRGQMLQPSSAR